MAMLKKSRRNLQACTEVGLISRVLGMLENAGDIVAGNMQGSGKHNLIFLRQYFGEKIKYLAFKTPF